MWTMLKYWMSGVQCVQKYAECGAVSKNVTIYLLKLLHHFLRFYNVISRADGIFTQWKEHNRLIIYIVDKFYEFKQMNNKDFHARHAHKIHIVPVPQLCIERMWKKCFVYFENLIE